MIDIKEIYSLSSAITKNEMRISAELGEVHPYHLLCGSYFPDKPIVCTQYMGNTIYDWLSTGSALMHLISERIFNLLVKNEFTGWKTYPVEVYKKNGEAIEKYFGLSIIGKCGQIDDSRSEEYIKERNTPKGITRTNKLRGYYFDETTWDGSDFFCPEKTGHIFVTQAVKKIFEEAKITNVVFEKIVEAERDIY